MCAGVAAPAEAQWRRIDSPNFVVIGDGPARNLRDVAVMFEGFREVLGRVLGARAIGTAVPTVIVAFQTDYAIRPFRPTYNGKPVDVAGLFVPRRDLNYIVMVNDGDAGRMRVVFHEYAHLITSNFGQPLPVWLSEGLAEYYSTFELGRGGREAVVGGLIDSHLSRLNDTVLIPLAELLKIDHKSPLYNEGSRRSVLYAQSWALTHLILLGEPSRGPELAAYLERLSAGAPPEQAWQEAFGALNMQRELENYIRRRMFRAIRLQFSEAVAKFEAPATAVPQADVEAYLADLHVQLGDLDAAAARLAQTAKLDPENARLAVGRARLGLARAPAETADTGLRAMAPPGDWLLAYLAAVSAAELAERRGGPPTPEDLATVRQFLAAARRTDAEFPNAVARLAALELRSAAGPSADTAEALERARNRAPGRHEYGLIHAQVLARLSQYAEARAVLGPYMTSHYPAHVRDAARDLMGFIVDRETARPGSGGGRSGSAPPSSMTMQPLFRKLQPGEQRLEGTLELIECVAGRGITFHVRSGGEIAKASAPRFNDVAFITYRSDLTGSVQCGPVQPSMAVYLTWRPGAEGAKIAVALEFLPKTQAVEPAIVPPVKESFHRYGHSTMISRSSSPPGCTASVYLYT